MGTVKLIDTSCTSIKEQSQCYKATFSYKFDEDENQHIYPVVILLCSTFVPLSADVRGVRKYNASQIQELTPTL